MSLIQKLKAKAESLPQVVMAVPMRVGLGWGMKIGVDGSEGESEVRNALGIKGSTWKGVRVKIEQMPMPKSKSELLSFARGILLDSKLYDVMEVTYCGEDRESFCAVTYKEEGPSLMKAPYYPGKIGGKKVVYRTDTLYADEDEAYGGETASLSPVLIVSALAVAVSAAGIAWREWRQQG